MTSSRGVRVGALAAVAVVTVAVVLVVLHLRHGSSSSGGPWYTALAASYTPAAGHTRTACGKVVGATTIGVAHPVLPCGAKLELEYGSKRVVVHVIDRHPTVPGHTFDLTPALAQELGVVGTQPIQWRFAK
ncbi:MAG TPA: septal ring lytic transglycosylase RlpA family protein [Gaiellaceae bacterium]